MSMKVQRKIALRWNPLFAYVIGLLVTDGSLSKDGRHISFTSKDREMIDNFHTALGAVYHIGRKTRGSEQEKKYYVVQIGDVRFYRFLQHIGLMPNKSKVIRSIRIPKKYFFDFLRGHFDGDGTFYSYWDPRWKSSFMFYTVFVSASKNHVEWLQQEIMHHLKIVGHITKSVHTSIYQLKYAKKESLRLLKKMYHPAGICLSRKRRKIEKALEINDKHQYNNAQVEKLVNSLP